MIVFSLKIIILVLGTGVEPVTLRSSGGCSTN